MTLYIEHDERNNIRVITAEGSRINLDRNIRSYYFIRERFKVLGEVMALDRTVTSLENLLLNTPPVWGEGVVED